ncbi:MAG TPA: fatty acid desaturase [Chitinophagaceae bacterium]
MGVIVFFIFTYCHLVAFYFIPHRISSYAGNGFSGTGCKKKLPYNYYRHQLATSLDYAPASHTVNFIFGGFNSHAAHHLFPAYPHTVYADIAPIIRELAAKHGYKYNCLPWYKAIASHFRYLHKLGNGYRAKREKIYRRLAMGN